jgi:HD-GYP domain-containing protein (c-di-GMP phosphodiesterase class II)
MIYVPVPLHRIEIGKPLPVHLWDAKGKLLLRKGQAIISEQHSEHLGAHGACATQADYKAWTHSYDRLVYTMVRDGMSILQIAKATMPAEILELDYTVSEDIIGDWVDVQTVLTHVLYPGAAARNPLGRLEGVQRRALALLAQDADNSLFSLFQALGDKTLGYCATHALLCAVVCELTARKLGVDAIIRPVLVQAALTMNLSMAKLQDVLALQRNAPAADQRQHIQQHAQASTALLRGFGVVNEDLLDIVAWHHDPDPTHGLERNLEYRRILHLVDVYVAKIAARSTRAGLPAIKAAQSSIIGASSEDARVAMAISSVLGFYPPGTYVRLANGEKAVCVQRGASATTPMVVSTVNPQGLPLGVYVLRDTRDKSFAIQSPLGADSFKVHHERVFRAAGRPVASS